MTLPINYQRPPQIADKPPIIRYVTREDVTWNRPIFRAPPLSVAVPVIDASELRPTGKFTPDSSAR